MDHEDLKDSWQYVILEDIALRAPLQVVLPKLVHMLEALLPGSQASVLVLEGNRLRVAAAPSLPDFYNQAIDGVEIGPAVGSCGSAAYSGQPSLVSDIQADPRWANFRELAEKAGLRACWSTPILSRERVLGTFAIYFPHPAEPQAEYLLWMQRAQHLACLALESERAVQQLRDSEERYRTLVDHAKDGMFLLDENFVVLDVNRSACESLQYSSEELTGSAASLFAPYFNDSELTSEVRERKLSGQEFQLESRHCRRDGTTFPVEVRARPFEDHGQKRILMLVSDISDRKVAQAALERQRQLLLEAQHIAGLGHFELNLQSGQFACSDSLCRIYGIQSNQFQPGLEGYLSRVHPDDREAVERSLRAAVASLTPLSTRERIVRPDGQIRVLETNGKVECDEAGKPAHLIGASLDITERLETEMALQRANEIAHLTSWVYDVQSQSFHVQAGGSVLLDRWQSWVHPEDLSMVLSEWEETLATGRPYDAQYRLVRGGRLSWVRVWANPVRSVDGKIERISGLTQDITVQRKLEEQLRESQKMEAVGRLAGGVAHDFNNLLTVIQGYTALLESDATDESNQEAIRSIRDASNRAAGLTSQLLAFSRRTYVEPQVVDMNQLIQSASGLVRSLLGEEIPCRLQLAADPCVLRIDPTHFEQVLMNLAVNARDAMPEGGSLEIQTIRGSREVSMLVRDGGRGMDSQVLEHIFEPFFTTKEMGNGTGLGLAVVHGVVNRWGGNIQVESTPGQGTCFRIAFPLVLEHPLAPPREPAREVVRGNETILWVEDEPALRKVTRKALESNGYRVIAPAAATQALEIDPTSIDLLLTDVVMPDMSGTELAAQLLARRPDLPVLYVSGYTDDRIPAENLKSGLQGFLQKPFTPASLARKVRQILDARGN